MNATYIECSSKEMRGVDQVFELAVNTAIEIEESSHDDVNATSDGAVAVKPGKKAKKRTCRFL